jgi:hypothetical protein
MSRPIFQLGIRETIFMHHLDCQAWNMGFVASFEYNQPVTANPYRFDSPTTSPSERAHWEEWRDGHFAAREFKDKILKQVLNA